MILLHWPNSGKWIMSWFVKHWLQASHTYHLIICPSYHASILLCPEDAKERTRKDRLTIKNVKKSNGNNIATKFG